LEFGGGRREENRRKTLGARTRTNNKFKPHDTGPELNPGHIGGRRALSPPCSQLNSLLRSYGTSVIEDEVVSRLFI